MNCKNCQAELPIEYKYCNHCGSKVVKERITLKSLLTDLLSSFGWDNQFFVTLRDLIIRPQTVFEKYLGGTRKRYTNPFTFFAIGAALSVFVISFYSEEMIRISVESSLKPSETLINKTIEDTKNPETRDTSEEAMQKQQALSEKLMGFMFNYFYYVSFLFLPFYAFIALLVYGKPENFGEHLVINAYLHGLLFFFGILLVALTMQFQRDLYSGGSILVTVFYYLYAYKRYRKHRIGKTILLFLKFCGIMVIVFILLGFIGFFFGKFFLD